LVPVDGGILCIRRGIPPHVGKLALPGGFIDLGESWQAACSREVQEETGLLIDAKSITDFRVRSAPDSTLLVFGCSAPIGKADLPDFQPTNETTELVVVREPIELAFSLHTDALAAWFENAATM
jgi:ADP-ribose pyrophosphatase YjhB (NUDIX family)